MFKVEVRGLRELDRALSSLPKAVATRVLKKVGTAALEPMAARAAALAPERRGVLAFSVSISTRRTKRVRKQRKGGSNYFEIAMGPASGLGALYYATHAEFGTVDTPAHPYMRPAWDSEKHGALETVKDGLWVEIRKASDRLAQRSARAKR